MKGVLCSQSTQNRPESAIVPSHKVDFKSEISSRERWVQFSGRELA